MNNEICLLLNVDIDYWNGLIIPLTKLCKVHLEPQDGISYDVVIAQIGGEEDFPSIMKKANALAPRRIFFEPGLIIDPVICRQSNSVLMNDRDLVESLQDWVWKDQKEVEL